MFSYGTVVALYTSMRKHETRAAANREAVRLEAKTGRTYEVVYSVERQGWIAIPVDMRG